MPTFAKKETNSGKLYFSDKDADYLEKVSREVVEDHHNTPILFFKVDFKNSLRNFYGEMLFKKFQNPKGTEIRGVYKINQGEETSQGGIQNKLMKLTVSIYVEQLEELDVTPELGDYFGIGKRLYIIYDKTIEDVGPGNLQINRKRMRQDFFCIQEDDEALQKNAFGENLGLEKDILDNII